MMLTVARWLAVVFPFALLMGPAVADILGSLIAVLFLIHSILQHDFRWARPPWVALLLAVSIPCGISALLIHAPHEIVRGFGFVRFPLLMAALGFWVLRDELAQRRVLFGLLGVVVFLLADATYQTISGFDLLGHPRIEFPDFIRLTGPYRAPRVGLSIIWILFPAVFLLVDMIRRQQWRGMKAVLAYGALFLFLAWAMSVLYLTGERMPFIYGLFGLGLAMLLARGMRPFFMAVLGAGGIALALLLTLQPDMQSQQVGRAHRDIEHFQDSIYGRLFLSSARIMWQHPVFGVGPRQFRTECPKPMYGSEGFDAPENRCAEHPHNIYAELAAETGLPSLLLFVGGIAALFARCWRERARMMTDPLLTGLFIEACLRVWPFGSSPSLFAPWFASPMWLVLGLLVARLVNPPRSAA